MDITTQKANVDYTSTAIAKEGVPGSTKNTVDVATGIQAGVAGVPDAQNKAFLSVVNSMDLAPKASEVPVSDPELTAKMEQIQQLLNNSNSSEAARLLGRLMVELGALQRKEALNDRLLARDAAQAELKAGANKMDKAATATMSGAISSLVLGMVSAAASIAYAKFSAQAMMKAPDTQTGLAVAQQMNMKGGALGGLGNSASQFSNSIGQSVSQTHQADQAREQANAEVTKSEGELESTEQQALHEFISQMIQFLKELREIEAEELGVFAKG